MKLGVSLEHMFTKALDFFSQHELLSLIFAYNFLISSLLDIDIHTVVSTHGLLAEFTGFSGQLLLTRFGPNFKGKVKAGSKQCQGKVKVNVRSR